MTLVPETQVLALVRRGIINLLRHFLFSESSGCFSRLIKIVVATIASRKSMSLHIYFCHLAACVISFMIMIIFCRSSIDGSPCATNDRKNINKATQSNSSSVSVLCLMTLAWNPEKKHATYKAWRKKHDNKNIPAFPMCIFQDNSTTWILHFAWEGCCIEKLHIWVTNQLWVSQTRLSHRVTESQSHSRKRIYSCATRFKPLIRFDCPAFGFQIYLQSEFKTISNSIFVMLLISGYINTCISVTEPLVQYAQCDKSWRAIDSYRNSVAFLQNLSYSERCLESFVSILVRSNFWKVIHWLFISVRNASMLTSLLNCSLSLSKCPCYFSVLSLYLSSSLSFCWSGHVLETLSPHHSAANTFFYRSLVFNQVANKVSLGWRSATTSSFNSPNPLLLLWCPSLHLPPISHPPPSPHFDCKYVHRSPV